MTQQRPTSTKALSAYLKTQHTSLSAAIYKLGLSQELLDNDTIDAELLGRIARLRGVTPEQLAAFAAPYAAV